MMTTVADHAARRPCPFCEWPFTDMKQRLHGARRPMYFVQCCGCGARGPECDERTAATSGWQLASRVRLRLVKTCA